MNNLDEIERQKELQRDVEHASQLRKDAMAGKLQECPKCRKKAIFWNSLGEGGEGCFECLACGKVYPTEYSLFTAQVNARNEEKYKDSQRFSD